MGRIIDALTGGQDKCEIPGHGTDAALPEDVREKITRRRRAGDVDAALDPLADPEVKAAIARTRFEMLVGFQLTEDQLAYNVRR